MVARRRCIPPMAPVSPPQSSRIMAALAIGARSEVRPLLRSMSPFVAHCNEFGMPRSVFFRGHSLHDVLVASITARDPTET
jgi:hypothetical protein